MDEETALPSSDPLDRFVEDLRGDDPVLRHSAARELGEHRDEEAVEALIHALGHSDPVVREEAAFSLGKIGDPRAVEPLIEALRDPDAAAGAAHALVRLGDERAVGDLYPCLEPSEPLLVQSAALHALAELGERVVADTFIEIAADESRDPGVRMAAESELRALGVEPEERRVGFLPVWVIGMLAVAGAAVAAAATGASALMLIAVAGVLIAGANAGLRLKRSR